MGSEHRYRIVDVFSHAPLAGNALCVVLDPVADHLMPAIAREVNLSETTFPTVTGERSYDVRIFTPTAELPFAGHPTLGTAWVMGPGTWVQRSEGATVTVEVDAEGGHMIQPAPSYTEVDGDAPAAALGLAPTEGKRRAWIGETGGMRHLIVPTEQDIGRLAPSPADVAAVTQGRPMGLCAVRALGDDVLHVRVFVAGIGEDPGTGSAAGPIAVLARRLWGVAADLTINQGDEIGRPCRITVHADEHGPAVGGKVAACAEGVFTL